MASAVGAIESLETVAPPVAATGSRIVPIDAARGLAMFFSCLVHFAWWIEVRYKFPARVLVDIGMIATPTFLLLSGTVAGFVSGLHPKNIDSVRMSLLNRGLFVLLVGHFAIALAEAHHDGGLAMTLPTTYATDTIGVGCILAALFVATSLRWRWIAVGAVVFFVCWLEVFFWHTPNSWLEGTKELLVGGNDGDAHVFRYTSPLLQYLAIYAIGLPIGRWLSKSLCRPRGLLSTGHTLVSWGVAASACGALLRALRPLADMELTGGARHALHASLSIGQKLPPSPAYLLFYGGMGAAMTGALCVLWHYRVGAFAIQRLADIGRASLFVFVLQFFTIFTLPDILGLKPGPASALVFCANLLLLWIAARVWTAVGGNRWMTFGLRLPRRHISA